jgi:siroheme synthase
VRALKRADVALIDDLVSREVLQFLRPRTRVVDVGKRGGCRSTPQSFAAPCELQPHSAWCGLRDRGGVATDVWRLRTRAFR